MDSTELPADVALFIEGLDVITEDDIAGVPDAFGDDLVDGEGIPDPEEAAE